MPAMVKAVEGAEDSKEMAVAQLKEINLNEVDSKNIMDILNEVLR